MLDLRRQNIVQLKTTLSKTSMIAFGYLIQTLTLKQTKELKYFSDLQLILHMCQRLEEYQHHITFSCMTSKNYLNIARNSKLYRRNMMYILNSITFLKCIIILIM